MKVLAVNGATREQGNTDAITSMFIDGAREAGNDVHTAVLRELDISDCIGCCTCKRERRCHFNDDMTALRDAVVGSQILVLSSPLYFCEVTGLMKIFLDRLYFFYHPENKHLTSGKKALVMTTMGEKEAGFETQLIEEFYRRFLKALDMILLDMVFFTELMEKESFTKHHDELVRAFTLGNRLY
ncbi:MAG: flavodoxin family protein [candidate division WOR-3 bacterium]|nr:MAG: flavodoxin family protein [candidate division WOR-3 bacterium]